MIPENILNIQKLEDFKYILQIFLPVYSLICIILVFTVNSYSKHKESEKKSREEAQIFEMNPGPVIKCDYSGNILLWNYKAALIFGSLNKNGCIFNYLITPHEWEISELSEDEHIHFIYENQKEKFLFTLIKDSKIKSILLYGNNITRLSNVEDELYRKSIAIETSATPIMITDGNGTIIYANPALAENTGFSIKEMLGETPKILNSGYHEASYYAKFWDTINSGKVWTGEFYNKRKDDSRHWIQSIVTPILDGSGKSTSFIAVIEDITKKKKQEKRLEGQKRKRKKLTD